MTHPRVSANHLPNEFSENDQTVAKFFRTSRHLSAHVCTAIDLRVNAEVGRRQTHLEEEAQRRLSMPTMLEVKPEVASTIQARARERGLSVDVYLRELIDQKRTESETSNGLSSQ